MISSSRVQKRSAKKAVEGLLSVDERNRGTLTQDEGASVVLSSIANLVDGKSLGSPQAQKRLVEIVVGGLIKCRWVKQRHAFGTGPARTLFNFKLLTQAFALHNKNIL